MSQTLEIPSVDDFPGLRADLIRQADRKIAEFHMNPDNFKDGKDYRVGSIEIEFKIVTSFTSKYRI